MPKRMSADEERELLNFFKQGIPKSSALPKTQIVDTGGLSLKRLLSRTDSMRRSNADDVVIKLLKKVRTKNGLPSAIALITSASRKGTLHKTWVTGLTPDKNLSRQKVMVQCSCEDYTYTFEYANAAHSAARIFFCNGESPDEKNPGLIPGLCKHGVALAQEILTNNL
jgi:hypothetical protein